MKPLFSILAALVLSAGSAFAAQKTATIEVTGLFCASCPYIAAKAVNAVPSAKIVDGFYDPDKQLAQFVVEYDDALTTLDALVGATQEYGYPATLVPETANGDS